MNFLFAEEFGKAFIFKKIRPTIRKYFLKAGYEEVPYKFFGGLFWVTAVLTVIIYLGKIYPSLSETSAITTGLLSFLFWVVIQLVLMFIITLFYYFYLDIKI